jgi:hypothetical protein
LEGLHRFLSFSNFSLSWLEAETSRGVDMLPKTGIFDHVGSPRFSRHIPAYHGWLNPPLVYRGEQPRDGIGRNGLDSRQVHENIAASRGLFDFIQKSYCLIGVLDKRKILGGPYSALLLEAMKVMRE